MKKTGAGVFVEALLKEKVDTIFSYSGGSVIAIFDELHRHRHQIRCIQPRHEQAGTHAADAYARVSGKVGVMVATSGPGATNTITGIANAHLDSVPLVVITGQVHTSKIGTDAFQEADITGITFPLTKANFFVQSADELAMTLKKAFYIAKSGRPGPVLVDIPSNVQTSETEISYPDGPTDIELMNFASSNRPNPAPIIHAVKLLNKARRPLILAGGGVIFSDSAPLLNRFSESFNIPVTNTLMGHGINPGNDDLYYGGMGMHGSLYGNYAVQHADVILALGVRFNDRILGAPANFAPQAQIIHADIDPAVIGKNIRANVPIVGHIRHTLEALMVAGINNDFSGWISELKQYREENPLQYSRNGTLKPQHIVELASEIFPEDTIVATDVGQNQMWVAQYYRFRYPRTLVTSGGLGAMGFGLPASVGAAVARPDKQVLMFSGDGGFQMNIQELATVRQYKLPVKMIVLDNAFLGMVRQWQELLYEKRYSGTVMDDNPNFAEIARVYGIPARYIENWRDARSAVEELAAASGPMLLHARVDGEENVLPMIPAGKSLDQGLISLEKGEKYK